MSVSGVWGWCARCGGKSHRGGVRVDVFFVVPHRFDVKWCENAVVFNRLYIILMFLSVGTRRLSV